MLIVQELDIRIR